MTADQDKGFPPLKEMEYRDAFPEPHETWMCCNCGREYSGEICICEIAIKKDEIHKMLTLSTAHVSRETADDFETPAGMGTLPIFYEKREYGWFVFVSKDVEIDKDYPADIVEVLAYARARGCTWIMLDQDGPVVDGLKTHEW